MGIEDLEVSVEVKYEVEKPDLGKPIRQDGNFREYARKLLIFKKYHRYWFNSGVNYYPLYLPWKPGYIAEVECTGNDVMSEKFSGCYFVKYKREGRVYVGHIGTFNDSESKESKDVKTAWNNFAKDADIICGFRPSSYLSLEDVFKEKCYAIITADNKCYDLRVSICDHKITFLQKREVTTLNKNGLKNIFITT
jgi:hypothetical protein